MCQDGKFIEGGILLLIKRWPLLIAVFFDDLIFRNIAIFHMFSKPNFEKLICLTIKGRTTTFTYIYICTSLKTVNQKVSNF